MHQTAALLVQYSNIQAEQYVAGFALACIRQLPSYNSASYIHCIVSNLAYNIVVLTMWCPAVKQVAARQ